jgi:hypothetical protein
MASSFRHKEHPRLTIAYPGTETSSLKHGHGRGDRFAEKSTNERQEFDSACIHRGIDPNGAGTDSLLCLPMARAIVRCESSEHACKTLAQRAHQFVTQNIVEFILTLSGT